MIIFSTTDGAKLEYRPPQARQAVPLNGVLAIDGDTTPKTVPVHIEWRVSRGALIRMAARCLWASVQRA